MPTIYEAAGITPPTWMDGAQQKPLEGTSLVYTFDNANAPERHTAQYFELVGNRGIYKDGWMANTTPLRLPWVTSGYEPNPDDFKWELYNINEDFSQANNLAEKNPGKATIGASIRAISSRTSLRAMALAFSRPQRGMRCLRTKASACFQDLLCFLAHSSRYCPCSSAKVPLIRSACFSAAVSRRVFALHHGQCHLGRLPAGIGQTDQTSVAKVQPPRPAMVAVNQLP
jgi:hypothetical protein